MNSAPDTWTKWDPTEPPPLENGHSAPLLVAHGYGMGRAVAQLHARGDNGRGHWYLCGTQLLVPYVTHWQRLPEGPWPAKNLLPSQK